MTLRNWFSRKTRFPAIGEAKRPYTRKVETDDVSNSVPEHLSDAASAALENKAILAVFERIRSQALLEFTSSATEEMSRREAAHREIQAVDSVMLQLEVMRGANRRLVKTV